MRLSNIDDMRRAKSGRGSNFFSRYLCFFILLIICIFQFNIRRIYGFSIYPDEFGYWACAAEAVGYDWSDMASLGSYYSFGYSMILIPLLKICKDSVTAYRMAVGVNMLMQCASAWMLYGIYKRWHLRDKAHMPEKNFREDGNIVLLAAGCAVFYPAWSFYVQTTLTEGLLTFLYVFICYRMILLIEKPNMTGAVILALSFLYLYFVHMRTIGVIFAAVVTLSVFAWNRPACRKMLPVMAGILIAGAVCGSWLKESVTATVYAGADLQRLSVNDYAGQLDKIKEIGSMQGIWELFLSGVGKLYYLGIASFGLLYPALGCLCKDVLGIYGKVFSVPEKRFRPEAEVQSREYISLFCLLSFAGQFMVTAVNGIHPARLDGIVYGRYNEYILPVFLGIGVLSFREAGYKLREFLLSVVFTAILFGITFLNALHSGLTAMQGYFAPGISYLSDDWHYQFKEEFIKAFIFGIFLMALVRGCFCLLKYWKRPISCLPALAVILSMEILLTFCLQKKYTWIFNDVDYYNLQIYEYIEAYEVEMPVFYLYEGGVPYANLLQFAMRDKKIEIITLPGMKKKGEKIPDGKTWEEELPDPGFLIVNADCAYLEEIEEKYRKCTESHTFCLFLAE